MRGEPTGEVGAEVDPVRPGLPGRSELEVVRPGLPGRSRAVRADRVKEADRADRVKEAPRLGLPGRPGRSRDDRVKELALTGDDRVGEGGGCDMRAPVSDRSEAEPEPVARRPNGANCARGKLHETGADTGRRYDLDQVHWPEIDLDQV